jgi:DNA-directed RNA polymerase subunit RPC12/RpoP
MYEVIVCPLCGFSFRNVKTPTETKKIKCPMCGFEFANPQILPFTLKEFDKKL